MVATSHHSVTLTISAPSHCRGQELQSNDRIRRHRRRTGLLQREPPPLFQFRLLCAAAFGEVDGIQRCQSERSQRALDCR